jgi:hypothetical protein
MGTTKKRKNSLMNQKNKIQIVDGNDMSVWFIKVIEEAFIAGFDNGSRVQQKIKSHHKKEKKLTEWVDHIGENRHIPLLKEVLWEKYKKEHLSDNLLYNIPTSDYNE